MSEENKPESAPPPLESENLATGEETSLGDIQINHTVVASIVKISSLEVEGVVAVAGGFVDDIRGIFSSKESRAGIRVEEEGGAYHITVRVVLAFGVELARTAYEIQRAVSEQVEKMTNQSVSRVDVIIEEVRVPERGGSRESASSGS